jgi:hypothetical protein
LKHRSFENDRRQYLPGMNDAEVSLSHGTNVVLIWVESAAVVKMPVFSHSIKTSTLGKPRRQWSP